MFVSLDNICVPFSGLLCHEKNTIQVKYQEMSPEIVTYFNNYTNSFATFKIFI